MGLSAAASLGIAALALAAANADVPAPSPSPVDVGAQETVEVRLVTTDVVVLDGQDRTAAGLARGDFSMTVDGKPTPVETFDVECPAGSVDDPKGIRSGAARTAIAAAGEFTRRIVLALDYYHVPHITREEVFANVRDLVERRLAGDEELMLVALANGLRVEQPFTTDRRAILDALHRMEYDISLWNANYEHVTEQPIVDGLSALYEILSAMPGPKAVVLFSDGGWPGEDHENDFRALAALAASARASLYPVVSSGLTAPGAT